MTEFRVTIKEIEIYEIEIEADNKDDAVTEAWEMLTDGGTNKDEYHIDSDGDSEVEEIE